MSLARHATPIEGVDREEQHHDDDSASRSTWRRLSYDAFAPIEPLALIAQDPTPNIAAYKVSAIQRAVQVAFGILACCFASGIVFGFASLKPVLIAEGVYRELCASGAGDGEDFSAAPRLFDDESEIPCPEQDMRLNLFFIVGSITTNVSSLFAGAMLDRYGRRVCYLASSIFLAAGCILMGYAFAIPEFDGYLVGNFFLGLGGTFVFVPSFQLANAFPRHSGLVVAMVTGAFDASAAVFLFYRMAWDASGATFTPSQFFFGYLVVPVVIFLAEWTFMPREAYHSAPQLEEKIAKAQNPMRDVHISDDEISSDGELRRVRSNRALRRQARLDQIEDLLGDAEEREERAEQEEKRLVVSGVWGVLHGLPAHRQMLTPWFILIVLLTVLQMLRMNYFIATIRSQYRFMLDSEDYAEDINHFFDAALPIGGVVATPFIGVLLNNLSVATALAVLTVFIIIIGVLNCLPFLWAGYATVVAFVLFRPLYYSAMSDYATKVFGFATFGRVYGMIICLSGLVNFVQSGLDALTHGPLDGDPTPINIAMAVAGTILAVILTAFVAVQTREYKEELKEEAAPPERVPLIREETAEYGAVPQVQVTA